MSDANRPNGGNVMKRLRLLAVAAIILGLSWPGASLAQGVETDDAPDQQEASQPQASGNSNNIRSALGQRYKFNKRAYRPYYRYVVTNPGPPMSILNNQTASDFARQSSSDDQGFSDFEHSLDNQGTRMAQQYNSDQNAAANRQLTYNQASDITYQESQQAFQNTQEEMLLSGGAYNQPNLGFTPMPMLGGYGGGYGAGYGGGFGW